MWWIVGGIVLLILVLVLFVISSYNSLVTINTKVDESYATMDVYMKKRYDLIPNLVNTVKGYAEHEKSTFENVVKARNQAVDAKNLSEQIEAEGALNQSLGRLIAVAESYPDLKANQEFNKLMQELTQVETEIAQSRKYYNAIVRQLNIKVKAFPSNIISNMFGFSARPYFEITDETQRETVKVEF